MSGDLYIILNSFKHYLPSCSFHGILTLLIIILYCTPFHKNNNVTAAFTSYTLIVYHLLILLLLDDHASVGLEKMGFLVTASLHLEATHVSEATGKIMLN